MSEQEQLEIYRQFRTAQDKYTYFLLAAAGAAIAFALTRTQQANISLSLIPCGIAVVAWGMSFYSGCKHLAYLASAMYANEALLRVQSGQHPETGMNPGLVALASEGISSAIEKNSKRAARYGTLQFRLLVIGGLAFIAWHVLEMHLRTLGQ